MSNKELREYLPLKQGLRQIEISLQRSLVTQRVSSIKTRIKTILMLMRWLMIVSLREYLPLKQGLRRNVVVLWQYVHPLREYLPLKQGLRLTAFAPFFTNCSLREYLPLKQGLRLIKATIFEL